MDITEKPKPRTKVRKAQKALHPSDNKGTPHNQKRETDGKAIQNSTQDRIKTVNLVHGWDQPNKNTKFGAGENKQMLILRGSI